MPEAAARHASGNGIIEEQAQLERSDAMDNDVAQNEDKPEKSRTGSQRAEDKGGNAFYFPFIFKVHRLFRNTAKEIEI
jgi:hypothetical protein